MKQNIWLRISWVIASLIGGAAGAFAQTATWTPTPTLNWTITVTRTHTYTFTRTPTGTIPVTKTNTPTPTYPVTLWTSTDTITPTYPVPTSTNTPLPPVETPTNTTTPATLNCTVNENLEDGDLVTPYGGNWTAFTWGTVASASISITSPGAAGTNWALMIQGSTLDLSGGWGAEGGLNYGEVPVDLSGLFAGISFYVRSSTPITFRVQLKSAAGDGLSDYGANFVVGTSWQRVSVPRVQWASPSGTGTDLATALGQSQAFQWRSTGTNAAEAWVQVDEICVGALSVTPTPTVTVGAAPYVWQVPPADVATAIGCTPQAVQDARQYQLDDFLTYLILRLTVHCGCTSADIMRLRQNMGWDDIAAYYGVDWQTLVNEVLTLTANLPVEGVPPANYVRGAANNPANVPAVVPPKPVPTEQLVLLPPVSQEVCP